MENKISKKKYNVWITILSVAIPLVVAILFKIKLRDLGFNVKPLSFLPPIYATINGITALVLVCAIIAIKNGKRKLHENLMKFAIALSVAFLAMYVAYHMTSNPTKYGGDGVMKAIYFFILITHISLSIITIPLVLVSYVRALAEKFDKHKQITKYTFPVWLYVAVTGVIVYVMISPYYVQ